MNSQIKQSQIVRKKIENVFSAIKWNTWKKNASNDWLRMKRRNSRQKKMKRRLLNRNLSIRKSRRNKKKRTREPLKKKDAENSNDVWSISTFSTIENFVLVTRDFSPFSTWIIDSSVSKHMTSDKSIFVIKREIQTTINVINEEVLNARWIDDIKIKLNDQLMMMKKMLYVFELNANLFSISILNRREFVVTFNEKIVEIKNKNILIVIEIARGKMYKLQLISTAFLNSEAKIPKK